MFPSGIAAVLLVPALIAQAPTRAELKPGLLFTMSDFADGPSGFMTNRAEPGVALNLAKGEAAHPQSKGGALFRWQGFINILQPGMYKFSSMTSGELSVTVGGKPVLVGNIQGETAKLVDGDEIQLAAGIQQFEAVLVRKDGPARVELVWRGPGFRPEPIPYFFFGHLPKQRPASYAVDVAREQGRFLFEELSCVKCHKADSKDKLAATLVERTGPNLTEIGKRAYPGWMDAWLADPQKVRPNSSMPKMFADDANGKLERYAVVAYLASLGGPLPEFKPPTANNQYQKSLADGHKLFLTAGCAACHGDKLTQPPTVKKKDDDEDEKPEVLPEDSFYAAGTNGPKSFYLLGSPGSKTRPEAMATFLQNPLATNPHGRMPNMTLTGQEAQDLARFLCRQTDDKIERGMPEEPKEKPDSIYTPKDAKAFAKLKAADQWKEAGKSLLTSKGCVNCHAVEPDKKPLPGMTAAPLLSTLAGKSAGCISEKPSLGKVPVYPLDAKQKTALTTFLKSGLDGPGTPSPGYSAKIAFKRFNCLNCHNRDGEGGFAPELADKMRLLENAQNADDVSPPRLTQAGHKLRTAWFKQVLTQAGRARPWMTLKMPQYGDPNVGFLAEGVPKLEGTTTDDDIRKVEFTAAKVDAGRTLTGKTGHGCISCHDISGVQTGGTRGPDLALTQQRVRYDWYVRWMHQPQRLAPGTKMPQVLINGQSLLTTILAGDGDKQIEAMWAYFALGPGLPLPPDMEPPKGLVVTVKDRPEILRTFMPDNAGTKCIAVGFPGGTNFVFDAAQCRPGYAWSGNFLDASPVWNNRGGAPAKLLGPKFWTAPSGFPWAVTDSRTPPDFVNRASDPAFGFQLPEDRAYTGPRFVHFAGYGLDAAGVPAFKYLLTNALEKNELAIIEKFEPLPVAVASGMKRTIAVDVPAGKTAWFLADSAIAEPRALAADGSKIEIKDGEVPASSRIVSPAGNGRVTVLELVDPPMGAVWQLVSQPTGRWQILLRFPEPKDAMKYEFALRLWGLPRDDAELLKGLR